MKYIFRTFSTRLLHFFLISLLRNSKTTTPLGNTQNGTMNHKLTVQCAMKHSYTKVCYLTRNRPLRRKLRMSGHFQGEGVDFLNRTSLTPLRSFGKYQFKPFQLSFFSGFIYQDLF